MSFTEMIARKKKGQQGKSSESPVAAYLDNLNNAFARFDWQRGYDARSAGGKFQRVAGDYAFFAPYVHGVIEVKEVEHDFRLPFKNFEHSAVAKCMKRRLAGGLAIVLVHHTTTDLWRMLPISYFSHRDLSNGSWDLSDWTQYGSVKEMLDPVILEGVAALTDDDRYNAVVNAEEFVLAQNEDT